MPEFGEMAISPDGSAIVFDTVPGSGPVGTKFVLRKIDQLSTTPIAGTEESWSPSFSPDGKWLLFANETGLHKLKLNSATSNSVYQGKNLEGACWLNENTILLSWWLKSGH
jgi:Tol biopolymer transport system component